MSAKSALRREMKKILKGLCDDSKRLQSYEITEKVFQSQSYQEAKSISIYLHMSDEVQTRDILKHALSSKRCYIPRYYADNTKPMEMVLLKDWSDYESLPETKWKIKQPLDEDQSRPEALQHPDGLDLVLVPGLAFSLEGGRLGRGMGYYDAYLAKCGPGTRKMALAFREQVLEEGRVPMEDHDWKVEQVMTAL